MITNHTDISLALAVWLVSDNYDHITTPNYISATALMKPLRHIVLGPRVLATEKYRDVSDLIATSLGSSIHDSIEKAWLTNHARSLSLLGYPQEVIERVRINPADEEVLADPEIIPVYLEQRAFREFKGHSIGGKFDLVTEGIIQDAKSTSAYSWVHGTSDENYRLQMSLYRWIDSVQPVRRITEDYGRINFIFTDWQKSMARSNPKYPQSRIGHKEFPLLSLEETENWVSNKLNLIQTYKDAPEETIPECSDEELWLNAPVYKYYADPAKTSGRSTRNFDSVEEANSFQSDKGKGIVLTVKGEPKRCGFCEAYGICNQKEKYFGQD